MTEQPASLGHCLSLGLAAQQKLQRPPIGTAPRYTHFNAPPLHARMCIRYAAIGAQVLFGSYLFPFFRPASPI
jgi:hypothetical protein